MDERPHRRGGTALVVHPRSELYSAERELLETVTALVERGWRVVVAAPLVGPLAEEVVRRGAETRDITAAPTPTPGLLRPLDPARHVLAAITNALPARRLLRGLRPDVVYLATTSMPLWILRARARGIPVIVHVHGFGRRVPAPFRIVTPVALWFADRVIIDARSGRDALVKILPSLAGKIVELRPGIDATGALTDARPMLDGEVRILCLSRVQPGQGLDVAIDAVSRLARLGLDVHLVVLGTDAHGHVTALARRAGSAGIGDRVVFPGFLADVWTAIESADVILVPPRPSGLLSRSAFEAAVAGRPVVVGDVRGAADELEGFASVVWADADDAEAMADALHRIMTHWSVFRRTAAFFAPIAERRFSAADYRSSVAAAIDQVAGRSPRQVVAR